MHKFDFDIEEKEIADIGNISKLAKAQISWQNYIAELEQKLAESKRKLKQIQEDLLPEEMLNLGLTQIKLDSGHTIEVKETAYPSITAANRDKFHNWLRENGYGEIIKNEVKIAFGVGDDQKAKMLKKLIASRKALRDLLPEQKESIHHQTLKSFVKEMLEKGENLPDTITIHFAKKAVIK